jgi:hypothetical protein
MRLVHWQPLRRGALRGYADVEIPQLGLRLCGCAVFEKDGRRWAMPPARPRIENGELARDDNGRAVYEPTIEWIDPQLRAAFSDCICRRRREAAPGTPGFTWGSLE